MAARDPVNYAAVVASIRRGPVDDSVAAEAEAGVDTLAFLAGECEATDCDPSRAAHYTILDLSAALVALGGVASIDELIAWLRAELPGRARELAKAVAVKTPFDEMPVCSCGGAPEPASWH
jgi:hypothetical protein